MVIHAIETLGVQLTFFETFFLGHELGHAQQCEMWCQKVSTGAAEKLAKLGQIVHVVGNGPWAEVNARNFFLLIFLLFDLLFGHLWHKMAFLGHWVHAMKLGHSPHDSQNWPTYDC